MEEKYHKILINSSTCSFELKKLKSSYSLVKRKSTQKCNPLVQELKKPEMDCRRSTL
jgi:hypothetical protein